MVSWLTGDVVKVEPRGGDPMRHLFPTTPGSVVRQSPSFSAVNRAKRSIEFDLAVGDDRADLERLLGGADVFVTNLAVPERPTPLFNLYRTATTAGSCWPGWRPIVISPRCLLRSDTRR